MAQDAVMGDPKVSIPEPAEERQKRILPSGLRAVVAVGFAALIAGAGFAAVTALDSNPGDLFIGAGLAVFFTVVVSALRLGSSGQRKSGAPSRAEELKGNYDSVVAALCAALDLRDNITQGHTRRVSQIASVVAWQMGLRKEQMRQIEKAAILHDIGKIGIADAILSKPGPLTDDEWDQMKRHPELGYRVLREIDFLRDVAEVVYAQREHYDGSGYPRGLKGEDIPLGARIFAVVDAYDAMTSYRPYRRAMSHRRAMDEIARNAGAQFDPDVVRAFLEAERQGLLSGGWDGDGRGSTDEPRPSMAY